MRLSVIVPFHRNLSQLTRCLDGVARAAQELTPPPEVVLVADGAKEELDATAARTGARIIQLTEAHGPAIARNRGAAHASGDVLVFIDSDVVVHADGLRRLQRQLVEAPGIAAVFGAYDEVPSDPGFVSQMRNLGHAFVHERSSADAVTFWAGLGAVRTAAFRQVGGFDERFRRPAVEDIELGYRLTRAGFRIRLDPAVRGTHLKRWTAWGAVVSDVRDRGIPWTRLLYRYGSFRPDLNLTYRHRATVAFASLGMCALVLTWKTAWSLVVALGAFVAATALDAPLLHYLAERRGWGFALRAIPLRLAHYVASGIAFAAGTVVYFVIDARADAKQQKRSSS